THLWRALYGFFIAMCFSFLIGQPVLHFIQRPVKDALDEIYDRRARNAMFGKTKEAEAEKPTPFFQIAVDPEQFQAVLKGKPAEEVNQLPQPVTSEEKANYLDSNTGVLPPGFK